MIIKSSKYLCENYKIISELAHETGEPLFITHEGDADIVIISIEAFEESGNQIRRIKPSSEKTMMPIKKRSDGMSETELAQILVEMYESAGKGEQVAMIHLFSIKFAKELEQRGISKAEILKYADLSPSYQTEISKGIKLAKYVDIKPEYL